LSSAEIYADLKGLDLMAEIKLPTQAEAQQQMKKKLAEMDNFLQRLIFKRFIATFIDMVMLSVPAIIIMLPAMFLLPQKPVNLAALFNCVIFLIVALAMLLKDSHYQIGPLDGQSMGKKAMNIRVTDLAGKPITAMMSIRRNIIPALPLLVSAVSAALHIVQIPVISKFLGIAVILPLFLVALVANIYELYKIHTGEQNRRWGDELAGTVVRHD